jgi:hypothetical protein
MFNDKVLYGKNESFLDVVVGYFHHEKSRCLLLRQRMNICCGVLCYKLNNISTTVLRERLLLPDAQYYVRNKLAESYKKRYSFGFFNQRVHYYFQHVTTYFKQIKIIVNRKRSHLFFN